MIDTNAIIDGGGVVKNLIVVEDEWDLGGIPINDLVVNLGDVYNFSDKKFYHPDGTVCKTEAEIQAEIEAIIVLGKQSEESTETK